MAKSAFMKANCRFLFRGGYRLPGGHVPPTGHLVPVDFAGICVASSADPACDEYVVQQLRRMGVAHGRLDYTYGSAESHTARFLEHLLSKDIRVLLHFVQPIHEAREMPSAGAQDRWRAFLSAALDRWGDRLEAVEVGSTVNRRKWAGYTTDTFMTAWRIAHEEVRRRSVKLAGPNVTDFEPVYNVALLDRMQAEGLLPDIHTDNLFAERATEPENYDHKILGHTLAPLIKYNVIKKGRLLDRVASFYGISETWSTHVAWSKRRIDRVLPNVEEKQADYLSRYFLLAAASGALSRVYWGPMIGQREGVIDDGTDEYPEPIPHVTLYERTYGEVRAYKVRPALNAMKSFTSLIPGTRYEGRKSDGFGLEVHAFSGATGVVHAVWTTNGRGADPASFYRAEDLAEAEWYDRDGNRLRGVPGLVTESPRYARWPAGRIVEVKPGAGPAPGLAIHRSVYPFRAARWQGAVNARKVAECTALLDMIAPDKLESADRQAVLRDARNAVWQIADPRDAEGSLVVKRALLTKWHKKVLDCLKPSKARRSWNGACELLRRGIDTPEPVAFFEREQRPGLKVNYYLCAFVPDASSVRRYFTAYAAGAPSHDGVSARDFYGELTVFLLNVHRRGVYFRDLSAGNVLVLRDAGCRLRFSLIDTARARFFEQPATLRQRLSDLKRICHPLDWRGREAFVGLYLEALGESFTPVRRCPFAMYDLKHRLKKWRKRK